MTNIVVGQETGIFQAGSNASVAVAFAGAVTPGSTLYAFISCPNNPTFTCSDSVNGSWGAVLATHNDGANHQAAHFKFDSTAAGTPTVTITPNSSQASMFMIIAEIRNTSGYDVQISQVQAAGQGTGANATTTGTQSPSVQPGLIYASFVSYDGGNLTAGTGFATGQGGAGTHTNLTENLRYVSTSAIAGTCGSSVGSNCACFAAFFKEAAGVTGIPIAWIT